MATAFITPTSTVPVVENPDTDVVTLASGPALYFRDKDAKGPSIDKEPTVTVIPLEDDDEHEEATAGAETQYDSIGAAYAEMKKLPSALLEIANVEAELRLLAKSAKCLDLACGLGRYARPMVSEFGAESVLGVDISPEMVKEAQKAISSTPEDRALYGGAKIEFAVGDCSAPTRWPQGPFDLILACWLFNYAPDYDTLLSMWKNIGLNLADGGKLLAVVPCNTEDPERYMLQVERKRPFQKRMVYAEIAERVQHGVKIRVRADLEQHDIRFEAWLLKNSIYERAAREAGFKGKLEWRSPKVPGGASSDLLEQWQTYLKVPNFWLLVAEKN